MIRNENILNFIGTQFAGLYSKKVLILGAPGVGKGTFCEKASKELQIPHIASGDLIRAEIKTKTKIGKLFKQYSEAGKLVPDDVIIDLISSKIKKLDSGFLLDGFPRTIPQAHALQEAMPVDLVVSLDQPEEVIVQKISGRRVCSKCGKNYNIAHIKWENLELPPLLPKVDGVCDECGTKDSLIQRADDNEETVMTRLKIYAKDTAPLIGFYKKQGLLKEFKVTAGSKMLMKSFIKILKE